MKKFFVVLMVVIIGVCSLFLLTACSENRGEQYDRVILDKDRSGSYYSQSESYIVGTKGYDLGGNELLIEEIYYNSKTRTITVIMDNGRTCIIEVLDNDRVTCVKDIR